jgi:hypothetical protein
MKPLIYMLITIVVLIGCKSSNSSMADASIKSAPIATDSYRFNISFISIGSGTDRKAKEQFTKFVSEFEERNNTKLSYETVSWGREGEHDYCFKLTELNTKQQEKFITGLKELLKNSTLVRYNENVPCKKKR